MDALPMRRNLLLTLLLSLLVVLPAFFSISCNKERPVLPDDEEPVVDSTMTTLKFRNAGPYEVENLQLLIYRSDGTRQLETLLRFDGLPDSVEVVTTEGEKLVAAVANSPKALSPVALGRYDSLKELGWDFNDEDPESPIMSGQCATLQNNGEIVLEPLVCQVVIAAISNSMDDYELVETGLEGREDKDCPDPQPAKGNKEARKDKVRKAIKESKKKSAKGSRGRSGRKDRK